ncbi:MAG: acetyl-CoA carboxylase carboxyl transferase subunit alpha, partial [Rhodospirillales bacterium]|nr:acetyl-CoA carboxylase carboxyl transferase subunit alpha [Rhodospirillales bacterium]
LIDTIVPEPLGGAQCDAEAAVATVGEAIDLALSPLLGLDGATLRARRREKFLEMGRDVAI